MRNIFCVTQYFENVLTSYLGVLFQMSPDYMRERPERGGHDRDRI